MSLPDQNVQSSHTPAPQRCPPNPDLSALQASSPHQLPQAAQSLPACAPPAGAGSPAAACPAAQAAADRPLRQGPAGAAPAARTWQPPAGTAGPGLPRGALQAGPAACTRACQLSLPGRLLCTAKPGPGWRLIGRQDAGSPSTCPASCLELCGLVGTVDWLVDWLMEAVQAHVRLAVHCRVAESCRLDKTQKPCKCGISQQADAHRASCRFPRGHGQTFSTQDTDDILLLIGLLDLASCLQAKLRLAAKEVPHHVCKRHADRNRQALS